MDYFLKSPLGFLEPDSATWTNLACSNKLKQLWKALLFIVSAVVSLYLNQVLLLKSFQYNWLIEFLVCILLIFTLLHI